MFADEHNNHNKFYEIIENDDSSIDVNYGRVGQKVNQHHYSSWEKSFWELKNQKLYKGYTDVTLLHTENKPSKKLSEYDDFAKIDDKRVDKFLKLMFERQQALVQNNYTRPTDANQKMIDKAKTLINDLDVCYRDPNYAVWEFNGILKELFNTIPRKMGNVYDFIAHSKDDFEKIIEREETLLDALEVTLQSRQAESDNHKPTKPQTIAEANGIKVASVTFKEEDEVIRKLKDKNGSEKRFLRTIKIENDKTKQAFDDFVAKNNGIKRELLWHGSPNKNWWSIAVNGLDLKHSRNGMFGVGLYFAPKSGKSAGYMSTGSYWRGGNDNSGYLALFDVAVGKSYMPTATNSWSPSEALRKLKDKGNYDCVWAKEGNNGGFHLYNDEVIVYRNEQQTIKYLVEIQNKERNFSLDITKNCFNDKSFTDFTRISDGIEVTMQTDNEKLGLTQGTVFKIVNNYLSIDKKSTTKRFSNDDLWFIEREVKKCFFESEAEYEQFLNETKDCIGKNFADGKLNMLDMIDVCEQENYEIEM